VAAQRTAGDGEILLSEKIVFINLLSDHNGLIKVLNSAVRIIFFIVLLF
jgi:hypothetical protein